jgi:hypothetical protein
VEIEIANRVSEMREMSQIVFEEQCPVEKNNQVFETSTQ